MAPAASTVAILLPPRIPTTTNVNRCSALPCIPPRFSTTTPLFSPSFKHFPESQKFSLLQTGVSSEETSTSIDANELFADLKWDGAENKSTVLLYGGGAIAAVWLSSILVGSINSVPLSRRKELATDIEVLKKKIAGTE